MNRQQVPSPHFPCALSPRATTTPHEISLPKPRPPAHLPTQRHKPSTAKALSGNSWEPLPALIQNPANWQAAQTHTVGWQDLTRQPDFGNRSATTRSCRGRRKPTGTPRHPGQFRACCPRSRDALQIGDASPIFSSCDRCHQSRRLVVKKTITRRETNQKTRNQGRSVSPTTRPRPFVHSPLHPGSRTPVVVPTAHDETNPTPMTKL